jgi:uncharacterized protein
LILKHGKINSRITQGRSGPVLKAHTLGERLAVRQVPQRVCHSWGEWPQSEGTMRLRREMIQYLAQAIARDLLDKGFVEISENRDTLVDLIREVITEELQVEERLNDEVKELLRAYSSEFSRGEADYYKMFAMVKRRLAQERGLIL